MWIFTNFGFVSAVQHREKKETLLVRAREPGVLEHLAARHGLDLKIRTTPHADYLYRAEIAKDVFAAIIADEIGRINYANFKSAFRSPIAKNTHRSHDALMDVWMVMNDLQSDLDA